MRVALDWSGLQPVKGAPIDWSATDALVEQAAKANIELLPYFNSAPRWAVPQVRIPGGAGSKAPARLPTGGPAAAGWQALLEEAVSRYGPNGDFWATNPAVPVRPIRAWQIWNEANFKYFIARPNPAEYGRLVTLSHRAIKSVDPGAKVVLGGMFARPKGARTPSGKHKSLNWYASDFLDAMYEKTPGLKGKYDGFALHPYTNRYQDLTGEIEEVRDVMKDHKDPSKGLWITELGWSSQPPNPSVNIFAKGVSGQARELRGAFQLLRANQAKWRIQRLFWFSIGDLPGSCNFCDGSGLFGEGFVPKKAWFEYVKFAGGKPQ